MSCIYLFTDWHSACEVSRLQTVTRRSIHRWRPLMSRVGANEIPHVPWVNRLLSNVFNLSWKSSISVTSLTLPIMKSCLEAISSDCCSGLSIWMSCYLFSFSIENPNSEQMLCGVTKMLIIWLLHPISKPDTITRATTVFIRCAVISLPQKILSGRVFDVAPSCAARSAWVTTRIRGIFFLFPRQIL